MICFLVGCAEGASGTVVDVQHSCVTVAEPETYEQTTYRVSPDADISRDGSPVSLLEVQPGDEIDISVSTDDTGAEIATSVEATSTVTTFVDAESEADEEASTAANC